MLNGSLKSQDGGALIEFAMVLPLLLLLLFGFIEFGVLLYNQQVVTNASREVARAAIEPIPLLSPADVAAVADTHNEHLIKFGPSVPLAITPVESNRVYGHNVNVTVTWEHNFLTGFFGPVTLRSRTIVRMM